MAEGDVLSVLSQLATAYGCMLVIPGPNALVVLQSCRERSRIKPVLAAAAGVASGATLAAILAASSAAALPKGDGLETVGSIVFSAILLRAAVRLIWVSPRQQVQRPRTRPRSSLEPFLLGLGAALLNPFSVPYFVSFFLSHACTRPVTILACCMVFVMAGTWFTSLGLTASRLQDAPIPPVVRRATNLLLAATLVYMAALPFWRAAFVG